MESLKLTCDLVVLRGIYYRRAVVVLTRAGSELKLDRVLLQDFDECQVKCYACRAKRSSLSASAEGVFFGVAMACFPKKSA